MSSISPHRRARPRRPGRLLTATLGLLMASCGDTNPPASSSSAATGAATVSTVAPPTALPGAAAATPAPSLTAPPTPWQSPDALDHARTARKPVLFYVSSEWCPPCRALEASLFSTKAFWDATRDLVHVRVDGDDDGAQALVSRFEAWAYPTLLLLSPDGEELFRAHHAVSLDELTPALAAASATSGGFASALARLEKASPSPADCALFAAIDWSSAPTATLEGPARIDALKKAYQSCSASPTQPDAVRAALAAHLLGMAAMADMAADSASPGAAVRPLAKELLDTILHDAESAWAARTLITTWVKLVVPWHLGADRGPAFTSLRDRWLKAAANIASRPGAPLDMVLLAENPTIDFHALEQGTTPIAPALAARIEQTISRVDALAKTQAERHSVAGNAAYLLRSIGQKDRARDYLLAEIQKSDSPSHYQTTLSQWALADGDLDDARRLARAAVDSARGRPSRLQWMVNELALYREDPQDRPTLLARATAIYDLLFSADDAFLGRNKVRTAQLASLLDTARGDPTLVSLAATYGQRCKSLPESQRLDCQVHFASLGVPPK
ncbi:MAG: thioredoxin family protein [Polyangiaceae bacterium]